MNRIESVDSIRALAILSVIAIHTSPFLGNAFTESVFLQVGVVINQLSRFAVPFFFVISGYFWGLKIRRGDKLTVVSKDVAFRIFIVFIVWSIIYMFPYGLAFTFEHSFFELLKNAFWYIKYLLNNPIIIFFQGTKVHLWFLVSLLFAVFICSIFTHLKFEKSLYIFAFFIYVFGVLCKAYSVTPIGLNINFDTRNGPFFSTFLFSAGYYLTRFTPNQKWLLYGFGIFILGIISHFIEIYLLMKFFAVTPIQDYVFGTCLMGIGAAVFSLSNSRFLKLPYLSVFGKITLGIYAIHFIFVDIFTPLDQERNSVIWEVSYIFIVFALSVLSVKLLTKLEVFKRIIQ